MISAFASSVFILGIGILMACAMDGLPLRSAPAPARFAKPKGRPIRGPH